jgi:hypothetical protein
MHLLSLAPFITVAVAAVAPRAPTFGAGASASADVSVVVDALTTCSTQVKTCDSTVVSLDVSAQVDFAVVEKSFATLVSTFDTACSTIKTMGDAVIDDLITLMTALQPLQTACGQLVLDLIAKKDFIIGIGGCGGVAGFGVEFQASARALVEAVIGLFPGPVEGILKFAADLSGSFEAGFWEFGEGNCTSGGSGPGKGHGHPTGYPATSAVGGGYPTSLPQSDVSSEVLPTATGYPTAGCTVCSEEPLSTAPPAPSTTFSRPSSGTNSTSAPSTTPTNVVAGSSKTVVGGSIFAIIVAVAGSLIL